MDSARIAVLRTFTTATGAALAGPVGGLVGSLVGGLLPAALSQEHVDLVTDLVTRFSSRALEESGVQVSERLTPAQHERVNHDLQSAFRDACREALYDLGGNECFPGAWRRQERDVPAPAVYARSRASAHLWTTNSPLAAQVCDCFRELEQAIADQRLLPLDPPPTQPAASVYRYLEAETPHSLAGVLFDQLFAPFLARFKSLLLELPSLQDHLRAHLLDRTLVHLGELLKQRPETWRAFNRLMLEGLRREMRAATAAQSEALKRLDALLAAPASPAFAAWTGGMADLLTASGRIEKRVGEGFADLAARLARQHGEVLARFDELWFLGLRVEAKVDRQGLELVRIRRILEEGRRRDEDAPPVALDTPPAPGEPPYQGLHYFDQADADHFFGREQLTARLVTYLRAGQDGRRFLAVVGPSGSGKSSLVRAGLLPALRRGAVLDDGALPPDGSDRWLVRIITPTARPLAALAASLTAAAGAATTAVGLGDDLRSDPHSFGAAVRHMLDRNQAPHLLLVVDQFEELFTASKDEEERQSFVQSLMAAAQGDGVVTVVVVLRADFYSHCVRFETLRAALEQQQIIVGPMTTAELRRAIEEPARQGGWEFERGVVELILRDVGNESGALPLLSHALLQTWQRRRGRTMLLESYTASGGVHGAIARTAESVYRNFTPPQQAIARNILLRLTELGEGTPDTRRRARLGELLLYAGDDAAARHVLQRLANARLVTTGREAAGGQPTAEVAHEALIREWPTLRAWLEEDREGLRIHRRLTEDAVEWDRLNRDRSVLYRGTRLEIAHAWAREHRRELNKLEFTFLSESILAEKAARRAAREAQQRELAHARRLAEEQARRAEEQTAANRQLRRRAFLLGGALLVAALFLLLASGSALFAMAQRQDARRQAERALANQLASQARSHLDDLDQSLLLSLESLDVGGQETLLQPLTGLLERSNLAPSIPRSLSPPDDGPAIESLSSLLAGLNEAPALITFLHGHQEAVTAVAFSNDGRWLASGSHDGTITLWNAAERDDERVLAGHGSRVWAVAFSPDGRRLASADDGGKIILWEVDSGGMVAELPDEAPQAIRALAFSPDGAHLAAGGAARDVVLWELGADPPRARRLHEHTDTVRDLRFAPDGRILASVGDDGTINLWDVARGRPARASLVAPISVNTYNDDVVAVAYSPDGSLLATAGWDQSITLWDTATGQQVGPSLERHSAPIVDIAFSPDGSLLASSGVDRLLILWDMQSREPRQIMATGHSDWVNSLAFNDDGSLLALGSNDATVSLWDIERGVHLAQRHPHAHEALITRLAFSPAGPLIATGGSDGSVLFWDAEKRQPIFPQSRPHLGAVWSLAFDPSGRHLASGAADGNILLWDAASGAIDRRLLSKPRGGVTRLAFSPDGDLLAAAVCTEMVTETDACLASEIQLWDTASGERTPVALSGHAGWINGVFFRDDGTLLSAAADGAITVWNWEEGETIDTATAAEGQWGWSALALDRSAGVLAAAGCSRLDEQGCAEAMVVVSAAGEEVTLRGGADPITVLALTPDGRSVIAGDIGGALRQWTFGDDDGGEVIGRHDGAIYDLALSHDGETAVTVSEDGAFRLWDVGDRRPGEPAAAQEIDSRHLALVGSLVVSPDGQWLASGGSAGQILLWDATELKVSAVLTGHLGGVSGLAFTPDGRRLLSSSGDGTVATWNLDSRTRIDDFSPHPGTGGVAGLALTADGRTAAAVGCVDFDLQSFLCTAGQLVVWDLASYETLWTFDVGPPSGDYALALHPAGSAVAFGQTDGTIAVWDLEDGEQTTLRGHSNDVFALAFDAGGQRLISGSRDTNVIIWELAAGQEVESVRLSGHTNSVFTVAFSPDGRLAASAGADRTVRLWDVATGQPIGPLVGHEDFVTRIAFLPGGRSLISAGYDPYLLAWDVDFSSWRTRACQVAGRNLTLAEWTQYFGDARYRHTCP